MSISYTYELSITYTSTGATVSIASDGKTLATTELGKEALAGADVLYEDMVANSNVRLSQPERDIVAIASMSGLGKFLASQRR